MHFPSSAEDGTMHEPTLLLEPICQRDSCNEPSIVRQTVRVSRVAKYVSMLLLPEAPNSGNNLRLMNVADRG